MSGLLRQEQEQLTEGVVDQLALLGLVHAQRARIGVGGFGQRQLAQDRLDGRRRDSTAARLLEESGGHLRAALAVTGT